MAVVVLVRIKLYAAKPSKGFGFSKPAIPKNNSTSHMHLTDSRTTIVDGDNRIVKNWMFEEDHKSCGT